MTKLILAVALCGFIGAPALAQNAAPPTKLRPKAPSSEATVTVIVTNSRKADLVQLQAAERRLCQLEEGAWAG